MGASLAVLLSVGFDGEVSNEHPLLSSARQRNKEEKERFIRVSL
jgi:hypothetical protein